MINFILVLHYGKSHDRRVASYITYMFNIVPLLNFLNNMKLF